MPCTLAIVFPACSSHFSVKMKVALVCLALGLFVSTVQAAWHWPRLPKDNPIPVWLRELSKRDEHREG